MYRQCKYCDAVYVKVAGCANVYSSGGTSHVPDAEAQKDTGALEVEIVEEGDKFTVRYWIGGVFYLAQKAKDMLLAQSSVRAAKQREDQAMESKLNNARNNGTRELNIFCFNKVSWDEMRPITAAQLEELGEVAFEKEGEMEGLTRRTFESSLNKHQERNRKMLAQEMNRSVARA